MYIYIIVYASFLSESVSQFSCLTLLQSYICYFQDWIHEACSAWRKLFSLPPHFFLIQSAGPVPDGDRSEGTVWKHLPLTTQQDIATHCHFACLRPATFPASFCKFSAFWQKKSACFGFPTSYIQPTPSAMTWAVRSLFAVPSPGFPTFNAHQATPNLNLWWNPIAFCSTEWKGAFCQVDTIDFDLSCTKEWSLAPPSSILHPKWQWEIICFHDEMTNKWLWAMGYEWKIFQFLSSGGHWVVHITNDIYQLPSINKDK